jgi:hypothetical protein
LHHRLLGSPAVWGLSYLALIPAFAAGYTRMDGAFTQSTLAREPGILRAADQHFDWQLQDVAYNATRTGDEERYFVLVGDVMWQADGSNPSLTITLISGGLLFPHTDLECHGVLHSYEDWPTLAPPAEPGIAWLAFEPTDAAGSACLASLAPHIHHLSEAAIVYRHWDLPASPGLVNEFRRLRQAHAGDPTAATQRFGRMLYFSAMTVTTVGYGDIVPVSDNARYLVAGEAVTGVVLIGLFLNAVGRRRRDPP